MVQGGSGLIWKRLGEDVAQAIEAALPGGAPLADPVFGGAQGGGLDMAGARASDLFGAHQATSLQHLQMLDDRGEGHVEGLSQLRHRGRTATQAFDDLANQVPDGASVQADSLTGNFFVPGHDVYWLAPPSTIIPGASFADPDFIVVNQPEWSDYGLDGVAYARDQHPGVHYRLAFAEAGYSLLERD